MKLCNFFLSHVKQCKCRNQYIYMVLCSHVKQCKCKTLPPPPPPPPPHFRTSNGPLQKNSHQNMHPQLWICKKVWSLKVYNRKYHKIICKFKNIASNSEFGHKQGEIQKKTCKKNTLSLKGEEGGGTQKTINFSDTLSFTLFFILPECVLPLLLHMFSLLLHVQLL